MMTPLQMEQLQIGLLSLIHLLERRVVCFVFGLAEQETCSLHEITHTTIQYKQASTTIIGLPGESVRFSLASKTVCFGNNK